MKNVTGIQQENLRNVTSTTSEEESAALILAFSCKFIAYKTNINKWVPRFSHWRQISQIFKLLNMKYSKMLWGHYNKFVAISELSSIAQYFMLLECSFLYFLFILFKFKKSVSKIEASMSNKASCWFYKISNNNHQPCSTITFKLNLYLNQINASSVICYWHSVPLLVCFGPCNFYEFCLWSLYLQRVLVWPIYLMV